MSSPIISYYKLLFKHKQSFFNNKIFFCTYCTAFGITDCKTIEGSSYYYNYIIVGRSCDREVLEHHF